MIGPHYVIAPLFFILLVIAAYAVGADAEFRRINKEIADYGCAAYWKVHIDKEKP